MNEGCLMLICGTEGPARASLAGATPMDSHVTSLQTKARASGDGPAPRWLEGNSAFHPTQSPGRPQVDVSRHRHALPFFPSLNPGLY